MSRFIAVALGIALFFPPELKGWAQAANVDQAIIILKMLRPKTDIRPPQPRAKQRITSLTLPRIEPTS